MDSNNDTASRTIKASDFKAKCLKLIDEVADTNLEIVITKNGKPVAKLTPYREKPKTLFGIDRGRYKIIGDLDDAFDDVDWNAEIAQRWEHLP